MRMVDLIEKKRDGGVLTDEEIRFIIKGFTDGSIPDYQMSAFAMTVFYKGMTDHETAVLTDAMMRSGDTVDLSRFGDKSVDKHSTGGVGDKTTLIVAPIVSSLGGKMAKMSGRGLGHTGGTVDKLESIPGYQTTLSADAFMQQVEDVGVAVIGQSGNLTPADKKLYALRDVTATIDSLPLITSSIMSKKLAAGAHSIVLDVKIGSGAFMKTLEDGQKLAESMVRIGKACGRNVVAVMSNMDIPLGFYIGNALEVREAVEVLRGHGCPDAFDTDMMIEHLRMLKNGQAIDCPTYDYTIHNRADEVLHVEPRRVIVVEGIMIFVDKTLCDEMNIRIFVDADADVRLCRRIRRDVKKRGRSIDSVIDQYLTTVKPMHELYVEPSKKNANLIVPEGGKNLIALEMIINRIQRHIDGNAE